MLKPISAIESLALASPSVDLDATLFIQFGLFILLMIFLTFVLYKPYLKMRLEREKLTVGTQNNAIELQKKAKTLQEELEKKQQNSFSEAENQRKSEITKANEKATKILDDAKENAQKSMAESRNEMDDQIRNATTDAKTQAALLSDLMVNKLLKPMTKVV